MVASTPISVMQMMTSIMSSGEQDTMIKPENMGQMMGMMGSFTILRLMKLMGAANVQVTKEQMLGLNAALNKVKRV